MIVAVSLLAGLLAALALVAGPFAGGSEDEITGAILLGFAFGWTLLAVLSARFTDRPQRWAAGPGRGDGRSRPPGSSSSRPAPGSSTAPRLGLAAAAARARRLDGRAGSPPAIGPHAALAPVSGLRRPRRSPRWAAATTRVRSATDGRPGAARGPASHRRRPASSEHPLHRLRQPDGRPRTGLGESASAMSRWIAPDVARTTTVCVYDRAGHGRSEAARDGRVDAARDLHVLLERAHVPRPYVIAGHSLGGMFALSYAHRYPAPDRRHRPAGLHAPAPAQRVRRHGSAARAPAHAGANRARGPVLRSQGGRPDDAGRASSSATSPRCRPSSTGRPS